MEPQATDNGPANADPMEIDEILQQFATSRALPLEAIEAARRRREDCIPVFLRVIEEAIAGATAADEADSPIFLVFHMLGEWREKSAFGPLLRLLQCEPERVEAWLGDALTETAGRVMAGVFDGDPMPLRQGILNPEANEWVRDALFDALANLARAGVIDRDETERFLRDCFIDLSPRAEHQIWIGWASAVAMLGLKELVSLVRKVFGRGFIGPIYMDYEDFKDDLDNAMRTRDEASPPLPVFGDTTDEFRGWSFASGEEGDEDIDWDGGPGFEDDLDFRDGGAATQLVEAILRAPAENIYRHVGRNDPCICGSGRKYKKCCMP